jgi:hypothetical protein
VRLYLWCTTYGLAGHKIFLLYSSNFFLVFLMFLVLFEGVGDKHCYVGSFLLYTCPLSCLCNCCLTCNFVNFLCSFVFHVSSLAFFSQGRYIFDELFTVSLPGSWISFVNGDNIGIMVYFDVLCGLRLVCIEC